MAGGVLALGSLAPGTECVAADLRTVPDGPGSPGYTSPSRPACLGAQGTYITNEHTAGRPPQGPRLLPANCADATGPCKTIGIGSIRTIQGPFHNGSDKSQEGPCDHAQDQERHCLAAYVRLQKGISHMHVADKSSTSAWNGRTKQETGRRPRFTG